MIIDRNFFLYIISMNFSKKQFAILVVSIFLSVYLFIYTS